MEETKKFQRTIEDFTCEHCGATVSGNGYTNHCPKCLWSKHVDINPGDRAQNCGGLMKPVGLEQKGREVMIAHVCQDCGFRRRTKTVPEDDSEALIALSSGRLS